MSVEQKPHVTAAFPTLCEGASVSPQLIKKPAHATITVLSNGSREVGCAYLNRTDGTCNASVNEKCVQLFPGKQMDVLILPKKASTIAQETLSNIQTGENSVIKPPPLGVRGRRRISDSDTHEQKAVGPEEPKSGRTYPDDWLTPKVYRSESKK